MKMESFEAVESNERPTVTITRGSIPIYRRGYAARHPLDSRALLGNSDQYRSFPRTAIDNDLPSHVPAVFSTSRSLSASGTDDRYRHLPKDSTVEDLPSHSTSAFSTSRCLPYSGNGDQYRLESKVSIGEELPPQSATTFLIPRSLPYSGNGNQYRKMQKTSTDEDLPPHSIASFSTPRSLSYSGNSNQHRPGSKTANDNDLPSQSIAVSSLPSSLMYSNSSIKFIHLNRGNERGRCGRMRGRGSRPMNIDSSRFMEKSRANADEVPPVAIPDTNLRLPGVVLRNPLPTDRTLPVFQLPTEDPLTLSEQFLPATSCNEPAASSNPSAISSKMKSSMDDIDFESLKSYRRLSGYNLFKIVSKKKYGVSDEPDQKSQNRRWQALWATLPEKVRRDWASRARRALKQISSASDRKLTAERKRENDIKRTENQLRRSRVAKYGLLELSAHFKLLSETFAKAADLTGHYRGPVDMECVESILLDGLVTCLIPLTALAGEVEALSGSPDSETICAGLSNLSHVFPTL